MNGSIGSIPILTKEIANIKNGEPIPEHQFSGLVTQTYESSNLVSDLKIFSYYFLIQQCPRNCQEL